MCYTCVHTELRFSYILTFFHWAPHWGHIYIFHPASCVLWEGPEHLMCAVPFIRHEKPVLFHPSSWHAVIKSWVITVEGWHPSGPSSKCSFLSASLFGPINTLVPTHWFPGSLQALQTISKLLKLHLCCLGYVYTCAFFIWYAQFLLRLCLASTLLQSFNPQKWRTSETLALLHISVDEPKCRVL